MYTQKNDSNSPSSAVCRHNSFLPSPRRPGQLWGAETLHVALVYTNPRRWDSRRRLFLECRRHLATFPQVAVHACELAYGDRPFEVTTPDDLQLRTHDELWHKENLINLCVRSFPAGWRYGATIDGDFHMTQMGWAEEAIQQLQHHPFVQLYSNLVYLSPTHRPHRMMPSFGWNWLNRRKMCRADQDSPGADDALKEAGGFPAPFCAQMSAGSIDSRESSLRERKYARRSSRSCGLFPVSRRTPWLS